MKTTQKECRAMINNGKALDLNEVKSDELYELVHHLDKLAIGFSVYGMNCGIFVDRRTGDMYACPSRSTALFAVC